MWCEQCYSSFNDLCLNDSPTSLPPGPFPCSQTNLFSFTHPTPLLTSSTCHSSDLPSTATTLDHEFLLPVTDQNSLLISLSTDTPSTLAVYSVPQSEQIFCIIFLTEDQTQSCNNTKNLNIPFISCTNCLHVVPSFTPILSLLHANTCMHFFKII